MLEGSAHAEQALTAVGEILAAEGKSAAIVIVGGAALNLLGVVDRATRDVDVMALAEPSDTEHPKLSEPGEDLPSIYPGQFVSPPKR